MPPQEIGAAVEPPIADCCFPAPPVPELDAEAKVRPAIPDRFGKPGRQSGEFIYMIAIDSKNCIYTGEAGNGRRMQR